MSEPTHGARARSAVRTLLPAALAVVLAIAADGVVRWLAAAAVLALAPDAWARAAAWSRLRDRLPHVIFAVVFVALLGELVLGHAPASRDHGIHYFQVRILVDELLPSGALSGWSERLNHGYPYGESYPVLGYLWAATPHLLSFGAIPLRTSYAWGLLGVWALSCWAIWQLAATIVREVSSNDTDDAAAPGVDIERRAAWAGCIGALAWLLDPGASRVGGWNYLLFHGVWPQQLAMALWTASIVLTLRALRRPSARSLALAGLAVGGALLAHPFALPTVAATAGILAVVVIALPAARTLPPGAVRIVAIVHVVGAALASGWLITFFASAGEMDRSPVPWLELGALATSAVRGELFAGPWAWWGVLALLGATVAVRRGGVAANTALALATALLVLGSTAAIVDLRLDLVTSAFENVQFPRYAIAIKPLFFALSGVGTLVIVHGMIALGSRTRARSAAARSAAARSAAARSAAARLVPALALAPLVVAGVEHAGRLVARPVGGIESLQAAGFDADEQALTDALARERWVLPADTSLRVAFLRVGMGGGTYPIFSVADAGGALVLDGHVPTINFLHRVNKRGPDALAALGVTHVVHDRPLGERETELADALEPVWTYGPYTLERLTRAPAARVRVVDGAAEASIVEDSRERMEIEVDGAATLALARAPSSRWAATQDGDEIEIGERALAGVTVIELEAPGSGRIVLSYRRSAGEAIGDALSWIALVAIGLGLARARPFAFAERLHSPAAVRVSRVIAAASAVLFAAWIVRRQDNSLARTWEEVAGELIERTDSRTARGFARDLVIEGEIEIERAPERACVGLLGKDALDGCDDDALAPHVSFMHRESYLYRCVEVGIAPGGTAKLRMGEAGADVIGMIARKGGGNAKHVTWRVGEMAAKKVGERRHDFLVKGAEEPGGAVVTIENEGGEVEVVCVAGAVME